jgi:hypothetical protein
MDTRRTIAGGCNRADGARNGGNTVTDDLRDEQIALLCDIGEYDPSKHAEDKGRDLERLIAGGYVERAGSRQAYKLTAKGNKLLGERGAGLNEA